MEIFEIFVIPFVDESSEQSLSEYEDESSDSPLLSTIF